MLIKRITKSLLLFLLIVCGFTVNAKNYYISNSGNDSNSGTDPSSPWKTLNKLNSFKNLAPGDNVLFARGSTFYGSITVANSGTSGNPITFGAYGTGQKPVITGFTNVTEWRSLGGNIWESRSAVSNLPYTNMVAVNGVNTAMGRYPNSTGPNTGYLVIKSHGKNSITAEELSGSNWTDAGIVIRKQRYAIEIGKITGQSGYTLNYSDGNVYSVTDGYGFFIQNHPKTLDVNGEWYYDPSSKKIRVYSNSTPGDVKVASVERLINISGAYITFDNLNINGANSYCIYISDSREHDVVIQNSDISFSGIDGVFCDQPYVRVKNNNISYINSDGVSLARPNCTVEYNNIKSVNVFEGMGQTKSTAGIRSAMANAVIQYNKVDSCGFKGIAFNGTNTIVKNNFVNVFCFEREDGAGIYTGNNTSSGSIIDGNIILNGIGAENGCVNPTENDVSGISIDDYGTGITITNNSIANCASIGIKLHKANNIVVNNNTTYNNGNSSWSKGGIEILYDANALARNITLNRNIFFAKTKEQLPFFASTANAGSDDIKSIGTGDNNYYAKPIDEKSAILIDRIFYNILDWKSFLGREANSQPAPKSITNLNDLRFEYNETSSSQTVRLDANYIDVKGAVYNGSISLAPYTSAVLIKNGELTNNQPPTVNAGSDRIVDLPKNSIILSGSAYDEDGTIASYLWTKISGPAGGTITDRNSDQSGLTDLIEGVYVYELKVTDNKGAIGTSTMKVTVNAENASFVIPNIPPDVNAGSDRIIDLPKNSMLLSGSAYDEDGTIASYLWTKISGPAGGIITDASSANSGLIDLEPGIYIFQLKVADNRGLTNTSSTQVTVNSVGNLLPALNPDNIVNGVNYSYYEGDNYAAIPDFSTLSPVKKGSNTNFDLSVADRSDRFAMDFDAYIDVPSDGEYTFYTSSDDGSMLYIDGQLVVNNDGLHSTKEKSGIIGLKAGKHSISVQFFEQTGEEVLVVNYGGPGILKQVIPSSSLYRTPDDLLPAVNPGSIVNGVDYSYYEEENYAAIPDFSKLTPVKTGNLSNFDLSVADRGEKFAINFDGYIDVPSDGQYTFYTSSDDGSMLYIDGLRVVNNDGLHSREEKSGTIGLKAGKHSISVGFFEQTGDEVLVVNYSGPGVSKQIVPSSALYRISENKTTTRMARSSFNSRDTGTVASNNMEVVTSDTHDITALQVGVKAYPNPFVNSIILNITGEAGSYKLFLVDALGRTMWRASGNKGAGTYNQTINTSALQRGVYFLKVIQNNNSSVVKLEK